MILSIRNSRTFRLFWFLLAVHFLNISVDSEDIRPDYTAEDLSINDQESVVEIVLEQFLDIENAIAEHDESDTEGQNNKKGGFNFELFSGNNLSKSYANDLETKSAKQILSGSKHRINSGFHRIDTPPPRS